MSANRSDYPKRIIPDDVPPGILALHLKRYDFASQWCVDRIVLDAACGAGYGAHYLAQVARRVVAVDIDRGAVAYAVSRYAAPNVSYQVMDCCRLGFADRTFDTICSFETIEHLAHVDNYLAEMARLLKPEGNYIASTPNASRTTRQPANPFHRQEWCPADFESLLHCYFDEAELYGQRRRRTWLHTFLQRLDILKLRARLVPLWLAHAGARAAGTSPMAALTLQDIVLSRDRLAEATEIVAVCRRPRKPSMPGASTDR